jgi:hypothetical protein
MEALLPRDGEERRGDVDRARDVTWAAGPTALPVVLGRRPHIDQLDVA